VPKLKPLKSERVIKVLEKLGFEQIRQSGSHIVFKHPNGQWTTVPIHKGKDIARGTLRKIIKDAGVTVEEFMDLI